LFSVFYNFLKLFVFFPQKIKKVFAGSKKSLTFVTAYEKMAG